jgi:hypothetical protein
MTSGATPLTTAEQERIVGMGRAGKTVRAIMEATGRSKGSVAGILHRNNVVLHRTRAVAAHRVLSSPKWRRTLAAGKAMAARNNPNSVARHAYVSYGDEAFKPKPVTLPSLSFMSMRLSWEDGSAAH